mgnify:CR=1 FL=1
MPQFKFPVTRVFLSILLVFTIFTSAMSAQTGIIIAQTGSTDGSGNLLTTEAGSTSSFMVVLLAKPTADVTVSISGADSTEHSLSSSLLTFTTASWDTAQTVTVTGVDDAIVDGDITTTLTAIASNTGGYTGTETATTTVKNTDDDTPDLTFTLINGGTEYSLTDCLTTASGSLEIPSVNNGLPVTSIGNSAFKDCIQITSITIPDSVTLIEEDAFNSCSSLTSIIIGNSVTSIGEEAFEDCSSLSSVTIPDSVITIGEEAFEDCYNLTNVNIGNSVSSIGTLAFAGSGLTSIVIPKNVTSIGDSTFANCSSLASVTIPDSVNSIIFNAFNNCTSLNSISFSNPLLEAAEAERDARPTQAAYDTVVAESNAKLTLDEVKDLRAGSTMIAVENGAATLSMEVEQSSDLGIWTTGGTASVQMNVQPGEDKKFFRFKMNDSDSSNKDINLSIEGSEYDEAAIIQALADQYGVPASSISLSVTGG